MSYTASQFKALIAAHINRDDQTTLISTACEMAAKRLGDMGWWFQEYEENLVTVALQYWLPYPTGFVKEFMATIRDTTGWLASKIPFENIDYLIKAANNTGKPYYYAMAEKIYFYPIPDTAYVLPLKFYKALAFPTTTANAWTDDVWDLTFWSVLEEVWQYLGNTDEMTKAVMKKTECLGRHRNRQGVNEGVGTIKATRF